MMKYKIIMVILFSLAVLFGFEFLGYIDLAGADEVNSELIRLAQSGYVLNTSIEDIEYRYRPLGEEPFFLREVKKCKIVVEPFHNGSALPVIEREVELEPGERIVNHLALTGRTEWSYLFYGDDRALSLFFGEITSSKPKFINGELRKQIIKGTALESGEASRLKRYNIRFNSAGRIRKYNYILHENGMPALFLYIYNVHYDQEGAIESIFFGEGTYGYYQNWYVDNIEYNTDGDVISWRQKYIPLS